MNSTSRVWRTTGVLSLLSTLLLIAGFLYAVRDVILPGAVGSGAEVHQGTAGNPEEESNVPPQKAEVLNVTAIGDSLAKGTGDDSGKGFARRFVELIKEQGMDSKLVNNLGINGLTTEGLMALLDEKGVQYSLSQAHIIILSIGGNDLFDGGENLQTAGKLPTELDLEQSVSQASMRLGAIADKIRETNPEAQLVYISLYNPFSDLPGMREIGDEAVSRWNHIVTNILRERERTLVVPTFDLFTYNSQKYLASDHFHPNGAGYQIIAERMMQGIY
ncbi:GDSL-type esterase/lipase family protein [Paenibacillus bouchesdurhonensis]|uniref:GDSL-type esterase/lipase family protein n=1 Tax=Paenibacillus bouchesdurhonensis TaxID=1870990 RepID=UPI000DA5F292|nr:GDSL-type esterase/lipase family protein [Paenibacillus bouchesdurhonensis]